MKDWMLTVVALSIFHIDCSNMELNIDNLGPPVHRPTFDYGLPEDEANVVSSIFFQCSRYAGPVKGDCAICSFPLDNASLLPVRTPECHHNFHTTCLTEWIKRRLDNPTCPMCRRDLSNQVSPDGRNVIHLDAEGRQIELADDELYTPHMPGHPPVIIRMPNSQASAGLNGPARHASGGFGGLGVPNVQEHRRDTYPGTIRGEGSNQVMRDIRAELSSLRDEVQRMQEQRRRKRP